MASAAKLIVIDGLAIDYRGGTELGTYTPIPDRRLHWRVESTPQGDFITSVISGQVFDLKNRVDNDGTHVCAWNKKDLKADVDNQLWSLENNKYLSKMPGKRAVTLDGNGRDRIVVVRKPDPAKDNVQLIKFLDAPPDVTLAFNNETDKEVVIVFKDRDNEQILKLAPKAKQSLVVAQGATYAPTSASNAKLQPEVIRADNSKTVDITEVANVVLPKPVLNIDDKNFSTLLLTWNSPAAPANAGPITEYRIEQVVPQAHTEKFSGSESSFRFEGAVANTDYAFKVVAVYGDKTVEGDVVKINHKAVPPGKPTLAWQEAEDFNVVLTWMAAPDYGVPLTKYTITQVAPPGQQPIVVDGAATSHKIKLEKHVTYTFQVRATNAGGDGPVSNSVTIRLTPPPPTKPILKYRREGDNFILTWSASPNGGPAITKYSLYQYAPPTDDGEPFIFDAATLTYTVKAVPKVQYKFFVFATNADNVNSPRSDVVTFIIDKLVPQKPKLTMTWIAADQVKFNWSVSDDGGSPITSYTLMQRLPKTLVCYEKGVDTEAIVNVPALKRHSFFVVATNAVGDSEPSDPIEFDPRMPDEAPEAPRAVRFSKSEPNKVTIEWESDTKARPDENRPIPSGYRVVQESPVAKHIDVPATQTSVDLDVPAGSADPKVYVLGVAQKDGAPLLGARSRVLTAGAALGAPVLSYTISGKNVTLNWTNVAGADKYVLQQYKPSINEDDPVGVLTKSFVGELGKTYKFAVYASTPAGVDSQRSNYVEFTLSAYKPNAPTLSYKIIGNEIHLDWNVPYNGTSPITSYTVVRTKPAPEVPYNVGNVQHLDYPEKIVPGVEYQFQVFATNDVGDGDRSNTVTITVPRRPPPDINARIVGKSENSAVIQWDVPNLANLAPDTVFDVLMISPSAQTLATGITGNSYVATGLKDGTNYTFQVIVRNSDGRCPSSYLPVQTDKKAPVIPHTPTLYLVPANPQAPTDYKLNINDLPDNFKDHTYEIEINGVVGATGVKGAYYGGKVQEDVQYTFRVRSRDPSGNASAWSNSVTYIARSQFQQMAGRWSAYYRLPPCYNSYQVFNIVFDGSKMVATKLVATNDNYVPVGRVSFWAGRDLRGQITVAYWGYRNPQQKDCTITWNGPNQFTLLQHNTGDRITYTRC